MKLLDFLGQAGGMWTAGAVLAGVFAVTAAVATGATVSDELSVYWSDGDSGRLSDGTRFRLHGVDAPETGGVGAFGGAECEAEREIGYEAKAVAVELSRDADIRVTGNYGADRYGRLIVDLAINGEDAAEAFIRVGSHRPWDYDGGEKKPDWCSMISDGLVVAPR